MWYQIACAMVVKHTHCYTYLIVKRMVSSCGDIGTCALCESTVLLLHAHRGLMSFSPDSQCINCRILSRRWKQK